MSGGTQATLRTLLVNEYGSLKGRLARKFGSMDFASEVLHDLYLRLDRPHQIASLRNPMAYLFRMALNIATDHINEDGRLLTNAEIDELRSEDQDAMDPARIVEARANVELLTRAMAGLSPRQRDILLASRLDTVPTKTLAKRFGISERTVERELKSGLEHCRQEMQSKVNAMRHSATRDLNGDALKPSADQRDGKE